ncbi:hypothetical protein OROMI_003479 [Orobanche minor]
MYEQMVPVDSKLAILVPRFTVLVNKRLICFVFFIAVEHSHQIKYAENRIITELEESPIAAYWCKGGYSFGSIMAHLAVNNFAGGPSPVQSEITSPDPPLPEPQRCTVRRFRLFYELVTKDTVDENVYEIAKWKLNLDAGVLKSGVEAENEA